MKQKSIDPLRLDVAAFAADAGECAGEFALADMGRLVDLAVAEEIPGLFASWEARGESRPVAGGAPEVWLHLSGQAPVPVTCQRCLSPVVCPVEVERSFRFVATEEEAEALDAELEDDVLVLERWMSLRDLVEDELLLGLPLVPRHEICPDPLLPPGGEAAPDPAMEKPHPFAALGKLKQRPQ